MRNYARQALAAADNPLVIKRADFSAAFNKCTPPGGWPRKIAVANSGGPDSTCLLFLLNRFIQDHAIPKNAYHKSSDPGTEAKVEVPRQLFSLTVNHRLQPSANDMAISCERTAVSMGVKHYTSKILWGVHPFPPRPEDGTRFESTARTSRYTSLFDSMRNLDGGVLAFGHHADDQVETALIRLGKGSTEYGAGGMRFCRRWGMGGMKEGDYGFYGYEGMRKWIIRPLLDFPKDRILATCEAHGIKYVTDSTNFDPHITLRNAIRHRIQNNLPFTRAETDTSTPLPPDIQDELDSIESAVSSLESVDIDVTAGSEHLRGAVKFLSSQVQDIDDQVDNAIKRSRVGSPVGTLLLSARPLTTVREHSVRMAMVLRVMRYASLYPWGSLRADGKRSSASCQQIIDKLWDPNPNSWRTAVPFVAGGGVLWSPVLVNGSRIRFPELFTRGIRDGETFGWLASRQPPPNKDKMAAKGIVNPLHRDVTATLVGALKIKEAGLNPSPVEVLYDNRFVVRFDVTRMPSSIAETLLDPNNTDAILLRSATRWYWPQVVHQRHFAEVIHSQIEPGLEVSSSTLPEAMVDHTKYWTQTTATASDWISVFGARTLDQI